MKGGIGKALRRNWLVSPRRKLRTWTGSTLLSGGDLEKLVGCFVLPGMYLFRKRDPLMR